MVFHIKKLGVKIGIRILQGLIALQKGLTFFLFIAAQPFRIFGMIIWKCGGRATTLGILRLLHAMRLQKSPASRPLVVLFTFLLLGAIGYQFISTRDGASTTKKIQESVEEAAPQTDRTAGNASMPLQTIEVFPTLPGEDEEAAPLPTIAGGNALLAPTINTTRLENRLREEPEIYLVHEGDTLSDIAERFGISIETILWENKLSLRSLLRPGRELTILPVSGIAHIVQRGETIGRIAKRYKVEERTILDFNELHDTSTLALGQKLIIPEGERSEEKIIRQRQPTRVTRLPSRPQTPTITPSGLRLLIPIAYRRISQWFTYRHSGIDLAGAYGTPIKAAEDGMVVQSGWGTGYGLYVLIDHGNGLMTRYAHNAKNLVARGDTVEKGERIALLGSTGRSTGPHVHFETIVNGRFVNPLRYIKF